MENYLVNHEKMLDFCQLLFVKGGLSEVEAKTVSEMLVAANVRGVDSHGVRRVQRYINGLNKGAATKNNNSQIVNESASGAVIDAHGCLGSLVSEQAVEIAREKARTNNIGLVVVRNSNHFGMAGYWALKLAADDMIGFCGSNTFQGMVPTGAKKVGIGNNPFAFAYSGEKYKEVCIDMASSMSAVGKAFELASKGLPLPEGFLDENGNPTKDVSKIRMVMPFAGHKGFGIAFIVETLANFLSGGVLSQNMNSQMDETKPENASHYFGAIKIETFRELNEFRTDVDLYIDFLKGLPTQEGISSVMYPGEIEYRHKKKALEEGIVVNGQSIGVLTEIAKGFGLTLEQTSFLTAKKID